MNKLRVICSTRDDNMGIGNLLFLVVDDNTDWYDMTGESTIITDIKGDKYEVYDYVREDDIDNRYEEES